MAVAWIASVQALYRNVEQETPEFGMICTALYKDWLIFKQ